MINRTEVLTASLLIAINLRIFESLRGRLKKAQKMQCLMRGMQ